LVRSWCHRKDHAAAYHSYEHRKAAMVTSLTSIAVSAPSAIDAHPASIRFRDPQIEMAHGAGGKASRKLVEGLFAPLLFGGVPGPLADAAQVDITVPGLQITTDSFCGQASEFPGRIDRRARGERHGE